MAQLLQMFTGNALDLSQLSTTVPMIFSDPNVRVKPQFGGKRLAIYMHVPWLLTIIGIKIKPI
jgi:hypothetical protein